MASNKHPRAGGGVEDLAAKGELGGGGHGAGDDFSVVEGGLDRVDKLVVCLTSTYLLPVGKLVTINYVVATQNALQSMDCLPQT